MYGDTDAAGERRIKTVFALIPRGARKTTLGAALALLHTIGPERVPGGYAVSVACDREQARIAFDEARAMIKMPKPLVAATWVRDSRNLIEHPKSGSRYYAASSDAKAAWGKTPTFALADELHAWYGETLWRAIRTGMAKSPGSILWITTTAVPGKAAGLVTLRVRPEGCRRRLWSMKASCRSCTSPATGSTSMPTGATSGCGTRSTLG